MYYTLPMWGMHVSIQIKNLIVIAFVHLPMQLTNINEVIYCLGNLDQRKLIFLFHNNNIASNIFKNALKTVQIINLTLCQI